MRPALAAALLGAVLALGCGGQTAGPTEAAQPLRISASAVDIPPTDLHGLRLLGTVELAADHPAFGGFSGLLVEDGRLTAVTDQGWLLTARLDRGDEVLRLVDASFAPLPGDSGSGDKGSSDAESLARQDGRLAIGFERDHRIELLDAGRVRKTLHHRHFERMASNNGLEALATLPDGSLLAIAEAPLDGAFPAFIFRPGGEVVAGALPLAGRHYVTGADLGPDGWLYLVRRDWSILAGLSARVERYLPGPDGFPRPETREVLASFDSSSGIDNMEGIALWREPDTGLRLAILSDDNFGLLQRTLLIEFEVLE